MKARQYLYAGGLALAVAAALGLSVSVTQADPKKTPKVPAIQVDAVVAQVAAAKFSRS